MNGWTEQRISAHILFWSLCHRLNPTQSLHVDHWAIFLQLSCYLFGSHKNCVWLFLVHTLCVIDMLWPDGALWRHASNYISGNGSLPENTKRLPEPILNVSSNTHQKYIIKNLLNWNIHLKTICSKYRPLALIIWSGPSVLVGQKRNMNMAGVLQLSF